MPAELQANASLNALNAFGVNATAAWLAHVQCESDLAPVLADRRVAGWPQLVLGGGTNILFASDFPGLVVRVGIPGLRAAGQTGDSWLFEIGAGMDWHHTVQSLLEAGFGGLENLALIPGTVGAAPIQNIGAYGLEIAERLHSVRAWDCRGQAVVQMDAAECGFGYRDSVFKREYKGSRIVLSVTLALPKRWQPVLGYTELDRELKALSNQTPSAGEIFNAVCAIRRRKLPDPALLGNAGSFFKNPIVTREKRTELISHFPSLVSYALSGGRFKLAAGWLIEACGMKGASRGRAAVYDRQALVLVNRGGATGREILDLASEVQARVAEKFGVVLEPEAVIV
ncbi:MAG: UDP-N-acetylmuramate dehydrogenase [Betaproteobacteria bacterium]|jgi:UDP-N-acetylmuramate dehydrogenase|nr:MAG: UDP-N-acetylmuramate dehydrogenase [Betaproteobacteria bacterium]